MGSLPNTAAETQQLDLEDSSPTERVQWLINSPEPPSLWQELVGTVKGSLLTPGKKNSSKGKHAMSLLQGLFPILSWGRTYKASFFKHDLMAGLTLASLSIPQSIGYANLAKLDPQYGLCKLLKNKAFHFLMLKVSCS